jgi:hypothetical protein
MKRQASVKKALRATLQEKERNAKEQSEALEEMQCKLASRYMQDPPVAEHLCQRAASKELDRLLPDGQGRGVKNCQIRIGICAR